MKQDTLTFSERYEANKPLREAACQKYYADKFKFYSLNDARAKGLKKYGNWICLVTMPEGEKFYTVTNFQAKWVHEGMGLGNWNELTLIEKAN